jgi:hypothetical protein
MDIKTQAKATAILKNIENTLDNALELNLKHSLRNWIEELSQIISAEFMITNLPAPPEKSVNIFVCEENLIDRIKEIEEILRIALHSCYGLRIKLDYCKEVPG